MIEYRDLQKAPFIDGGRDPETGLDCWGLFIEAMRRFGHEIPDFQISCFDSAFINSMFIEQTNGKRLWTPVPTAAAGVAVTLKLDTYMPNMVQHYGVCLDRKRFIHTMAKAGVLVTRLDHRFFSRKIDGFFAWNP